MAKLRSRRKPFKKRKLSDVGTLAIGATTAIIGVSLLSETANAIKKI